MMPDQGCSGLLLSLGCTTRKRWVPESGCLLAIWESSVAMAHLLKIPMEVLPYCIVLNFLFHFTATQVHSYLVSPSCSLCPSTYTPDFAYSDTILYLCLLLSYYVEILICTRSPPNQAAGSLFIAAADFQDQTWSACIRTYRVHVCSRVYHAAVH